MGVIRHADAGYPLAKQTAADNCLALNQKINAHKA
jgi:urocanate hydratase